MTSEGSDGDTTQDRAVSCANDAGTCVDGGTWLTQSRSRHVHGHTYFVRKNDEIKIGFSAYPWRRLKGLKRQFPGLLVLAVVRSEVAGEFETHQQFAHLRLTGEWFRAAPDLLAFIEKLSREIKPKLTAVEILHAQLTSIQRRRGVNKYAKQHCAVIKQASAFIEDATDPWQLRALRGSIADQAGRLAKLKGEE
jgi:hypothetical protein